MSFAFDFGIGFIAGVDFIRIAFVFEIELMTIVSDRLDIVQDGLVGQGNIPDIFQHVSGFTGGNGIGDM